MSRFGVTPKKEAELTVRMEACGLREADLEESFIQSRGPGGQKVNRSASCVRLLHKPTGIDVKMQRARSQALNRFYARRRLCELIEERTLGKASPEAQRHTAIHKQKRRRARRRTQRNSAQPDSRP